MLGYTPDDITELYKKYLVEDITKLLEFAKVEIPDARQGMVCMAAILMAQTKSQELKEMLCELIGLYVVMLDQKEKAGLN